MTKQEIDRIECAIRHIQTAVDIDPWAVEIAVDAMEKQVSKKPISAQPEIIRCKDCKWWSNDDYRECSSPNYDDGYVTPAGFYCGYAERRTDELGDS